MCAIFGLLNVSFVDAEIALNAIRNRGPDGTVLEEIDRQVLFGHARLAVIDLKTGQQPMSSIGGRYVIAYNGEIYNYRDLRTELEKLGCSFATNSDTEVILEGYARWGSSVLNRLDGMFAFAIWDKTKRELFCARDRMGVKPFFYAHGSAANGGFVFASTLAPFLKLSWFKRPLDFEAIRDFLAFQTVFSPRSFFKTVAQLPPASFLVWRPGESAKVERYWSIPQPERARIGAADLIETVDAAIGDSVKRQLVSDVPIGAFLSGGIDSSLIVRYIAAAGTDRIRTYSVRFADAEFDESSAALEVAKRFGAEHTTYDFEDTSGQAWLDLISELDQPLADPAYVPLAALARETRKSVTVALSGDGGDELFGGYSRFADAEANFPPNNWKRLAAGLIRSGLLPASLTGRSLWGRSLIHYRKVELGNFPGSRKDMAAYLHNDALVAASPARTLEHWHEQIDEAGGTADTNALMRADLWTYLSENCLVKTDRASMASGLEARVPLLGNPVLDLVLRYPSTVHFDPTPKAILRSLAKKYLPASVWDRPKHGFSVPLQSYFNGAWSDVGNDLVAQCGDLAPWLRADAVSLLWQNSRQKRGSRRLMYTFLVLLAWLSKNRAHVTF